MRADAGGLVDGRNLYAYVRQNPWTMFDPEGLEAATFMYNTPDDALVAGSLELQGHTPKPGEKPPGMVEYGVETYSDPKSNSEKFAYSEPHTNNKYGTVDVHPAPPGMKLEGFTHNHNNLDPEGVHFSQQGDVYSGDPKAKGDKGV